MWGTLRDRDLLRESDYLDGQWVHADDGGCLDVVNPANQVRIASVPKLGSTETQRAILAAHHAWPMWREKTAKERAALLRTWYDLIMANQNDLAYIMTMEQGKPLPESMGEVAYGASFVEWFAEEAKRIYGDVVPPNAHGRRIVVIRQGVGVVGAITPWNFPNAMITRKCAPALAAGCTVVVKPASQTPLSALALAYLAEKAGIPKGVFNVITGSAAEIGTVLTASPLVRKITFTGSTEVGKKLLAQSAETVKRVSMELGGNAPFIVFDDADLNAAIKGAMLSKFRNSGQTCVCANRFLVQREIHDAFVTRLAEAISELNVGPGIEPGVTQGPLINESAIINVEALLKDAVDRGASVITGGRRHALGGTFFEPTLLTHVTQTMAIAQNEIFGPVASIIRFETEPDAVTLANDTRFGLAAYLYTRDWGRVWRVSEALEYGMVSVNEGILSTEVAPFGGVKESGIGREGSRYGMDEYVEMKYLCLGGIDT